MALVFCNSGDTWALDQIVGKVAVEPLRMALFVNSQNPVGATAASSLTEASGGGYAKQALIPSSWVAAVGPPNTTQCSTISWTFTDSIGLVHGYFYVGSGSGKLVAAEQFSDGPYNIVRSGDAIVILPKITAA
jgi:hypothetical protein